MAKITNGITIVRDDQGNYVVIDYLGEHIFEERRNVMGYIESRLETQDARIAQYQQKPSAWLVDGISGLTM